MNNRYLAELKEWQRLFYFYLQFQANEAGIIEYNPELMRAHAFPYDDHTVEEIIETINALVERNLLSQHQVGGCDFVHVTDWQRLQKKGVATDEMRPHNLVCKCCRIGAIDSPVEYKVNDLVLARALLTDGEIERLPQGEETPRANFYRGKVIKVAQKNKIAMVEFNEFVSKGTLRFSFSELMPMPSHEDATENDDEEDEKEIIIIDVDEDLMDFDSYEDLQDLTSKVPHQIEGAA